MTYNPLLSKLPNVVFPALAPEKLDRMIDVALTHQQNQAPARRSNVIAFQAPKFMQAAWFTGTGALAASLFLAISFMPTPSQTVSATETTLNDLFAYQTLSR